MSLVLLVEDVALVRMTLRKFLEKAGHEVVECAGGDDATRMLRGRPFDVVVTDLWMQAGDGLDFIRRARAGGETLPILAITGGDPRSPLANSADAARDVGATTVLMKPVTKASLTTAVAETLAASKDQALQRATTLASDTSSSLGGMLLAQRADIIAAWQANTSALLAKRPDSPEIAGLLRAEAAEFLSELCRFVGDEDAGAEETSKSLVRLTTLAANASAAHAREGLTPSETSTFVLSFRDALVPFVVEAYKADASRLAAELARIGGIVDRLSIKAAETHAATRERTIERQSRAIIDLSTPVLQIWPQIVLMPLVGVVDTRRAQQVMEDLLNAIARDRALVAILDVTGVPVIDTRVALHLTKTVSAANMLGAQVIITGISPDAAQTLVKLDIDLKNIRTRGTLHFGLVEALRMLGQKVSTTPVKQGEA